MTQNRHNIILLSVDALRADHLSCYGYSRKTTPTLDALATNNIQFTNAFSVSSHTREAVPALLTGHYPDQAVSSEYVLQKDTVATPLQQSGYATGGFHSNPFVSRAFGFGDGFDTFDDDLYLGQNRLIALAQRAFDKFRNKHYARAAEINRRALDWIDSTATEPFFLWNHYMDPHGPYIPPADYRDQFDARRISDSESQSLYKKAINAPESISEAEQELLVDLYDAEIRYTDEQIGTFLQSLADRDLLANSLVIVTADHGELFGEYGYYEHPRYPYHELVAVPFIIRHPDGHTITDSTPVSTLDIAPTVYDHVGVDGPKTAGVSLAHRWEQPTATDETHRFGQASTVTDDGELLRRFSMHTETSCEIVEFRIDDDQATKTQLVCGSGESLSERLQAHATERIENTTHGRAEASDDTDPDATPDEIEDRLDALGYLER